MIFSSAMVTIVGRQMGISTRHRYFRSDVPSTLAAKYSESGTCAKFSFSR